MKLLFRPSSNMADEQNYIDIEDWADKEWNLNIGNKKSYPLNFNIIKIIVSRDKKLKERKKKIH